MTSPTVEVPEPPRGGYRGRSYCLRCYAPLGVTHGAAADCPRCGYANLRADQIEFWTHQPFLRRIEAAAKALIVIVTAAAVLFVMGFVLGTNGGWVMIFPAALGWALWMTASRITRRNTVLRAGMVWMNAALMAAPVLIVIGVVSGHWQIAAGGALALGIVPLVGWITARFERWRRHRVLTRCRAAAAEPSR